MSAVPKPVSQCQNRINFVEAFGKDMTVIAMVEIVYPKIRHGWHLAVVPVPLDASCTLKYTEVSQDDVSVVGPKGVWCLVTPNAVLHADEVAGVYQKYIDAGLLKYETQVYDPYSDTPVCL